MERTGNHPRAMAGERVNYSSSRSRLACAAMLSRLRKYAAFLSSDSAFLVTSKSSCERRRKPIVITHKARSNMPSQLPCLNKPKRMMRIAVGIEREAILLEGHRTLEAITTHKMESHSSLRRAFSRSSTDMLGVYVSSWYRCAAVFFAGSASKSISLFISARFHKIPTKDKP
jgi:hypothetical protein